MVFTQDEGPPPPRVTLTTSLPSPGPQSLTFSPWFHNILASSPSFPFLTSATASPVYLERSSTACPYRHAPRTECLSIPPPLPPCSSSSQSPSEGHFLAICLGKESLLSRSPRTLYDRVLWGKVLIPCIYSVAFIENVTFANVIKVILKGWGWGAVPTPISVPSGREH